MSQASPSLLSSQNILPQSLRSNLKKYVFRVKKLRRWHLVDPLTKAFIKAFMSIKLKSIKSIILIKTLVKVIKTLKELSCRELEYIKEGVKEAWRLSEIASTWGHAEAASWRNNKAYMLCLGLTVKWIHKLLGIV